MYKVIARLLFLLSPEVAHSFTMKSLGVLIRIPFVSSVLRSIYFVKNPQLFAGIEFPNRIGMGAGFDKNAKYLGELKALGFGHVEIGTVTPLPQSGNEQPRLFRLTKDHSLINRMGFNNDGAERIAVRLRKRPDGIIVGGNIGKNKDTPIENAVNDYVKCFTILYDVVDYFVVNVSSPNTPKLRELQNKEALGMILFTMTTLRKQWVNDGDKRKPILLKIAPDLSNSQLEDIISIVKESGVDGIVATNTTIKREGLKSDETIVQKTGAGGLSGELLSEMSTGVIRYIHENSGGTIAIIGVGGIHSLKSGKEKLNAGATLLQLYTGFIYEGPSLVKKLAGL